MDLINFENTTTLAIESVYRDYWNLIPEKYKLKELVQRQPNEKQQSSTKLKPISYEEVDRKENCIKDDYEIYCDCLNNDKRIDLQPFYDPQLDFESRLHYKLVGVNYPQRKNPWFVITWNFGNGILKSNLTNRKFDTAEVTTPTGENVKFDFIDTELELTLCFNSNSLQALVDLQEVIRIGRREKHTIDSLPHSILDHFTISQELIDVGNIAKASRDRSTLCTLTLTFKLSYPVIGNVISTDGIGIIKEFDVEGYGGIDTSPEGHALLFKDVINENT